MSFFSRFEQGIKINVQIFYSLSIRYKGVFKNKPQKALPVGIFPTPLHSNLKNPAGIAAGSSKKIEK